MLRAFAHAWWLAAPFFYTSVMLFITRMWVLVGEPRPQLWTGISIGLPLAFITRLTWRQTAVTGGLITVAMLLDALLGWRQFTILAEMPEGQAWLSPLLGIAVLGLPPVALLTVRQLIVAETWREALLRPDTKRKWSLARITATVILSLLVLVWTYFGLGIAWSTKGFDHIKRGGFFYDFLLSDFIKAVPLYGHCGGTVFYSTTGIDGHGLADESVIYLSETEESYLRNKYSSYFSKYQCEAVAMPDQKPGHTRDCPSIYRSHLISAKEGKCRRVHVTVFQE